MAEAKATNGVSGKKKVESKSRKSLLKDYKDCIEFIGMEFSPSTELILETNKNSEDSTGNNTGAESTTGKKEATATKGSYIQGGAIINRVFDPEILEQDKLEMKQKGESAKEQEQEQEQEKE